MVSRQLLRFGQLLRGTALNPGRLPSFSLALWVLSFDVLLQVHVVSARDEEEVDVEDPFAAEAESSGDEVVSGEDGSDSEMEPSEDGE